MKRYKHKKKVANVLPFAVDPASLSSFLLMTISIFLFLLSSIKSSLFVSLRTYTGDFLEPVLSVVGRPIQNISLFFHDMSGLTQLQAQNLRLEQENLRLREWYQTALLLDSENKALRQLLNLKVDPEYDHVSARVLADTGNAYVKSLLVDIGAEKGIKKGAAVLSGDGLIGRIVEVGERTSRILLITDINSRVPVVVEDTGQHAIMAGANEYSPRLIHESQDSRIAKGARLITSGFGGLYPHGIPVGQVFMDENQQPHVELFFEYDTIRFVRILVKKEDKKAGE